MTSFSQHRSCCEEPIGVTVRLRGPVGRGATITELDPRLLPPGVPPSLSITEVSLTFRSIRVSCKHQFERCVKARRRKRCLRGRMGEVRGWVPCAAVLERHLVAQMRLLYACVQLAYIFIQQISGRVLALYALIGIVTNSYSSMTRFKADFEVSVDCQNCQKSLKNSYK